MRKVFQGLRLAFAPALLALGGAAACGSPATEAELEAIDAIEEDIRGGTVSPTGAHEAIGTLNLGSCTATLITPTTVLTAAHCVCSGSSTTPIGSTPSYTCLKRSTFTFKNVFPRDNPATSVNESLSRRDVSVEGDVVVHPDFTKGQWNSNDYALVKLDRRVEELTLAVKPIQVERPYPLPAAGNAATIVGYGGIDDGAGDCDPSGVGTKRSAPVTIYELRRYDVDKDGDFDSVDSIAGRSIIFRDNARGACPGDSGGPALSASGRVLGVSSSYAGADSGYDPTYPIYGWLASHSCAPFDPRFPQTGFCGDPLCPCDLNEGDCDNDAECAGSLICAPNLGAQVGLPADYDICRPGPTQPPQAPSTACPAGQRCCEPGPSACQLCVSSTAACP